MVTPIIKHNIVKKRNGTFDRHHSNRFKRLDRSWRFPKGIDSRVRRRFRDLNKLPKIGYGSNKKTKHLLPDGFLKYVVSNVADIEVLLMHNRKYAAEIAHNVSSRKRKEILAKAAALNVKVTNKAARVRAEESA